MRIFNPRPAVWVVLGALAISGLTRIEAAPAQTPSVSRDASAADDNTSFDNLEIVDTSLKGKLAVLRVGTDYNEDEQLARNKPLSIFAGFRNKTSHTLDLEIQTVYKDKDGATLNTGSWVAFSLKPREEREYHSASISLDATDFVVRVRRATSPPAPSHK